MKYIGTSAVLVLSVVLAGCFGGSKDEATPLKFSSTQGNTTIEVGQEFRYDILVTPESARNYEITVTDLPDWLTLETEKSLPVPANDYPTVIEYLASDGDDIYFVSNNSYAYTLNSGIIIFKTRIGSTDEPQQVLSRTASSRFFGGLAISERILYVAEYYNSGSGMVTDFYKLNLANANATPEFIRQAPGQTKSIVVKDGRLTFTSESNKIRSFLVNNPSRLTEYLTENVVDPFSLIFGTMGIDAYGYIHMDVLGASRIIDWDTTTAQPGYASSEVGCISAIAGAANVGTYFAVDSCWKDNQSVSGKLRFVPVDGPSTGGGGAGQVIYSEGEVVFNKSTLAVTVTPSGQVVWSTIDKADSADPSLYTFSVQKNALVGTPTEAGTYPITLTLPGGEKQTFTITVTEPPVYYEVTGIAYGLQGSLQLSNNGTDTIRITNSDPAEVSSFGFNKKLEEGDAFDVAVAVSPALQTCTLRDEESASGEIGTSGVEVIVDCVFNTYAIGGTASGLDGTLVLTLNDGEATEQEISVTEDTFSFTGPFDVGFPYNVEIKTQPDGQECVLNNTFLNEEGEATTPVVSGPVSLSITCEDLPAEERTLSVTVEGLPGGTTIALRANGPADGRWLTESKAFGTGTGLFNSTMRDGETFDMVLLNGNESNPAGYTCSISGESPLSGDIDGLGTVDGNVTVTVSCVASGGGGGGGGELPPDPIFP